MFDCEALPLRAVLVVKDDDLGFEDDVLGVAEIEFSTAQIVKNPRVAHEMRVKLMPGDALGNLMDNKEVKVPAAPYFEFSHSTSPSRHPFALGLKV